MIFLGSAGAYLLGYQMATLSIISPAKFSTALLVLAVPIIDVAWQIVSRLRRGQHPFQGDRGRLHFRLADRGLDTRHIVVGYYLVAILFGLVAVTVASPILKLLMLGAIGLGVIALFTWLSRDDARKERRDAQGLAYPDLADWQLIVADSPTLIVPFQILRQVSFPVGIFMGALIDQPTCFTPASVSRLM